ncbi:MAG: FHA domain-containing protein [Lentisphaeria bacterium]|nr:FHA domain-containing protein [Lentisphaeria bacterium]
MRLTITKGAGEGTVFDLKEGTNTLGRSRSVDIKLDAPDISRQHLVITVTGEDAVAENLGRAGSALNGVPIDQPVSLMSGAKLTIGLSTEALFENPRESRLSPPPVVIDEPPSTDETGIQSGFTPPEEEIDATGVGDTGMDTPPWRPPAPEPAAQGTGMGFTYFPSDSSGDVFDSVVEGGTQIMQTRLASQEEIELLKRQQQKEGKIRLAMWGGGLGFLALLALIFWPRQEKPEDMLTWPKGAEGDYMDAFLPSPVFGSYAEGGYDLVFPGAKGWQHHTDEAGRLTVRTPIGRDQNVTMTLILTETEDKNELIKTRKDSLSDWMEAIKQTEGRWSFETPSGDLFLGGGNGIPCITVPYHREDDQAWFGMALFFRYGSRRIVLRREVPAEERVRAEDMVLNRFYVYPSPACVRGHWEGGGDIGSADPADQIQQVRIELEQASPPTWPAIETLIMSALRKTAMADDTKMNEEAARLLTRLRENQDRWFNAQKIAFFNAQAKGDLKQVNRITEICKGVFSDRSDQRYYEIRKNQW